MYDILINVIETAILGSFITYAAESRKRTSYIICMYLLYILIGTAMISCVNYYSLDESFYFIADVTLGTIYLCCISDKELSEKLLIAIIPELVLSLNSIALIVLWSYALYGRIDFILLKQTYPVQTDLAAQFIYICAFTLLAMISKKRKQTLNSRQKYFLCAILIVCHLLLNSVSTLILVDRMDDNHIALSVIYLFAIIMLLYIIFCDIADTNKKRYAAELDKSLLETQIISTEKMMKAQGELQKLHHDIKHLLKALDTESADVKTRRMIDQFSDKFAQNIMPIETGSVALNAVLNTYRQDAADKHIDFALILNLSEQAPLNNEDLCLLVSNLLDNAITHIGSGKKIHAELQSTADQFTVRIQNSIDFPVLRQDHTLRYAAESGHGYGIRTVQAIVDKYKGKLICDENDTDFVIMAIIPQTSANM